MRRGPLAQTRERAPPQASEKLRTHRDELSEVGRLELPEVAAGKELAREDDEDGRVEEGLEQAQAADLDLLGRVGLERAHLLAAGELLLALLLALQPLLVRLLALGAVLRIPGVAKVA